MNLEDYLLKSILSKKSALNKEYILKEKKLGAFKLKLPTLVKKIFFSYLNPFYVYFTFTRQQKTYNQHIKLQYNSFSQNFLSYIINHKNDSFNLTDYYPESDFPTLERFIKFRILTGIFNDHFFVRNEDFYFSDEYLIIREFELFKNKIFKNKKKYFINRSYGKIFLPINRFDPYIFTIDYGLKYLSVEILHELKGKVFLDIGAYIGGTALMLLKYDPEEIICYEPNSKNRELLKKTIALNSVQQRILISKFALGENPGEAKISLLDAGSQIVTNGGNDNIEKVKVSTIDIESRRKTIGLIKMDIEGFERYAVKGGLETIRRDKPLLLISLYHTGADFFEIPPLLKQQVKEYNFRFLDINPGCKNLGEKILLVYP